jgi:hypothetical protein
MITRHLNGDPADNRLTNIVYGTYKENLEDDIRNGILKGRAPWKVTAPCKSQECKRGAIAKGFCNKHYLREWKARTTS